MEKKVRWQQRLEDLDKASARLDEALNRKTFEELEKDGVIQRFEFTFELAWKTLKDYLEYNGVIDVNNPKSVLRKAFQDNLFKDGDLWLQMQEDRNLLSHMYRQEMSEKVFENIKSDYARALHDLVITLKKKLE